MLTSAQMPRPDGATLAYDTLPGHAPTVLFMHGLNSDRRGTKIEVLVRHCAAKGYGLVRYDMFGHGGSSGAFADATISRWVDDALALIDQVTSGPLILIGSSMGGWIAVKAAIAKSARVAGLIGIAAAPDFTEDLMWAHLTTEQREALARDGAVDLPSEYADQPYRISRALIEDGRKNLVLRGPIAITCPVRLLHGQSDASVPWQVSQTLAERINGDDVETILIKDGDHRLSRPQDLQRLCATLDALVAQVTA